MYRVPNPQRARTPLRRVTSPARLLGLGLGLVLFIAVPLAAETQSPYDEYKVKAALLYNFSKFVDWPATPDEAFSICVYGRDPYGEKIDAVGSRSTMGRGIVIARHGRLQEAGNCQIAVIGQSETYKVGEAIEYFQNHPVLTVGETSDFVDNGGVLALVRDDERIAFEINLSSARAAGLNISSHLLRIARRVVETDKQ